MRSKALTGTALVAFCLSCLICSACSDKTAGPGDGSTTCTGNDDCPTGQLCDEGICQDIGGDDDPLPCTQDSDCPADQHCENGTCREEVDGGVDGGDGSDGGDDTPTGPDIEIIEPPSAGDPPAHLLDFGSVMVGEAVVRTIRLRNAGTGDLRILDLAFEMGTVDDFYLDDATIQSLPLVIAPDEEASFDVFYLASDGINDYGVLSIISNDPDEARVTVQLESTFKGTADIAVEPASLNFGDVLLASQSSLSLTISNQGTGNAVLRVDGIQLASLTNDHFDLAALPTFPLFLNRGDAVEVNVEYHPTSLADHNDRVVVVSNDENDPQIEVPLSGRGVEPNLLVTPSPVDFGEVRVNEALNVLVTLTNQGGAPMTITGLTLNGATNEFNMTSDPADGFDLVTLSPETPQVLQAAESRMLTLSYTPIDEGSDEATLLIDSPDLDPSPRQVAVSGLGYLPPVIQFEPMALDFGDLHIRDTTTLPITVRNIGQRFLAVSDISVDGVSDAFTAVPSLLPNLGPMDEALVQITFGPQYTGPHQAELNLASNDPETPLVTLPLTGQSIDPTIFVVPMPPLNFGNVYNGQVVEQDVSVFNFGVGRLRVDSIELLVGTSDFSLTDLPAFPIELAPNTESFTFKLVYAPQEIAPDANTVRIVSNDLDNANLLLNTSGVGVGCPNGHWDINEDPEDGCEYVCVLTNGGQEACDIVDNDCDGQTDEDFILETNPNHCGQCNNECSYNNAQGVCANFLCEMGPCNTNFWDANDDPSDGCEYACIETNLGVEICDDRDNDCDDLIDEGFFTDTDELNCGACGNICSLYQATPVCVDGECEIDSCNSNFDDCDTDPLNGCEKNLLTDPENCNGCGNICSFPSAPAMCVDGVCTMGDCSGAFEDCDGNPDNGCETNLMTSEQHCGACLAPCSDPAEVCVDGACACGTVGDDCTLTETCCGILCVDTTLDDRHCGACGNACDDNEECVDSACHCGGDGEDCTGGDICCGNTCHDPLTSTEHCGSCGTTCDPNEQCTPSGCRCGGGALDCTAPLSCCGTACVDLDSNETHCGLCNNACDAPHANETCTAGVCLTVSCQAGWGDCDPGQEGCETDLTSSIDHCGGCDEPCLNDHGARICNAGTCAPTCDPLWGNCDANPDNGCEQDLHDMAHCGACGAICQRANATATCDTGACLIDTCNAGWTDCNLAPIDGCEIDTAGDENNCGTCGTRCTNANGATICINGTCTPSCDAGWGDCDGDPRDGCETYTDGNISHCGACSNPCANPNGTTSCSNGQCQPVCVPGYADCDGEPDNGCETDIWQDTSCGNTCGANPDCTAQIQNAGGATCASGTCNYLACDSGFGDCDGNRSNGCETDFSNSDGNCGACGVVCQDINSSNICSAGVCTPTCADGWGDCDGQPADGCETNLNTADANCGTCGTVCQDINGTNICTAGICVPSCSADYGNCNGSNPDGCETNLNTSDGNCGACGTVCQDINGTNICTAGTCVPSCSSGWGSCDGDPTDGCETDLNSADGNCGACGIVCQDVNGTNVCSGGDCVPSCSSGFGNCNGIDPDGCESNLNISDNNCGTCGTTCLDNNGTNVCSGGTCTPTCDSGWGSCDSNPINGCETYTDGNINHCGACLNTCSNANGSTSCTNGNCIPVCNPGFANCDGDPDDGCETDIYQDTACGPTCSPLVNCLTQVQHADGEACVSGICNYSTCDAGYGNCDGNRANGCEADYNTSDTNCGACGIVCQDVNGSNVCTAGTCTPSCSSGWGDCDSNPNNGCEANLNASDANCGACGVLCQDIHSNNTCSGGSCVPACSTGWGDCDSDPTDGCEADLNTSDVNCGSCGNACQDIHSTNLCSSGTCVPVCASGWGNCDGDPDDGCETDLTTAANCGSCGNTCLPINGSNACVLGACAPSCNPGWADCDGNPSNGCETNLNTDDGNCGTCGTVCLEQNGTNSCSAGSCSPICFSGYGDCDSNPINGCEINTNTNDNNCGSCGNQCQDINADNACNGLGVCVPICDSGWASCDGDPDDGCEIYTDGNDNNCGSCGTVCQDFHANNSCDTGVCSPACATGYTDCANPADGCETYTDGDLNNCGGCGTLCSRANATPQCTLGNCSISICNANYWNTDEIDGNGCECADLTDPSVGNSCAAATDVPTISASHTLETRNGTLVYWDIDGNPQRNDRDCWRVPYESPNPGSGNFRVRFTDAEEALRFDVYRNDCATAVCSGTGDNTFTSWCSSTTDSICPNGNSNDFIVCVKVAAGFDNVCEPYQIRFEYY